MVLTSLLKLNLAMIHAINLLGFLKRCATDGKKKP